MANHESDAALPGEPTKEEWRLDDRGELDDVVVPNVACFRLERMGKGQWWIGLYRANGSLVHIDLYAKRAEVTATKRDD